MSNSSPRLASAGRAATASSTFLGSARLIAPTIEHRPVSPIRRSGSPLRRKQILELERLPLKKQKNVTFDDQTVKLAHDSAALHQVTAKVEKIALTIESQNNHTLLVQQEILKELKLLRLAVDTLQKDVLALLEKK